MAPIERNACKRFADDFNKWFSEDFASFATLRPRQLTYLRQRITRTIEWIELYDKRVEFVEERISTTFEQAVELLSRWIIHENDKIVIKYYAIPCPGAVPIGPFTTRRQAVKHLPDNVKRAFYGEARLCSLGTKTKC